MDGTSHGNVVECERITIIRGTGSVTRSAAEKLRNARPGAAARLPGVQVAEAAQSSRKSRSQLRSSTCEPEVGEGIEYKRVFSSTKGPITLERTDRRSSRHSSA